LGDGRAPVRLSRVRPARGRIDPHAARRVSGAPHVGGQSCVPRSSGACRIGVRPGGSRGRRRPGPAARQPAPEGRASTRRTRSLPHAQRRRAGSGAFRPGPALGPEPLRRPSLAPGHCRALWYSSWPGGRSRGITGDPRAGRRPGGGQQVKVLVSGHHGYIGSVLAPLLAEAGHDVTGLDLDLYAGFDFGLELGDVPSLQRDVRKTPEEALAGFDAVVHLAALSNDPLGDLNEEWTYDVNRDGTLALARAAREAGVRRFVFASSCSMYGASGSDEALDES